MSDIKGPESNAANATGDFERVTVSKGGTKTALDIAVIDSSGNRIDSFGGGTQYAEGATAATITGTAILWEDTSDTLATVSAANPLPITIISGASSGTQYTEADVDATITGTAIMWEDAADTLRAVSATNPLPIGDAGGSLTVDNAGTFAVQAAQSGAWTVTANAGTDLNTSLLALESGGNLAAAATSLAILDDWDETNRAAVNLIAAQVGVAGGTGVDAANVIRVSLATDIALPVGTNAIGKLAANSGVDIGDVDVTSLPSSTNAGATVKTDDYDTGAGTDTVTMFGIALPASGGAVAGGTSTDPIRIDPTGTTTQPISDGGGSLTIDGTVAATQSGTWNINNISGTVSLPTGAATAANQSTANTALSGIQTAVEIMDDWDETNRCAVNLISGQIGVAGGSGTDSALTLRTSLATDVALPAGTNALGSVNRTVASSSALSNVAGAATTTTLLASNASRRGATIVNDSTAILYVKFGATASTSSYSYRLSSNATLEFPEPMYTGVVDGIWASATGNARITELT